MDIENIVEILDKNKGHFDHIIDILKVNNPSFIDPLSAHIFVNLFRLSKKSKYICEFGIGDGISALFMIIANPNSKFILFYEPNEQNDKYIEYLTLFFPNRITGVKGDYRETIPPFLSYKSNFVNLIHINDIKNEEQFIRCLHNSKWIANKNDHNIVINNFLTNKMINKWCITSVGNCILNHPSGDGLYALTNKTMSHFVTKFNHKIARNSIVVARYDRDLEWIKDCDLNGIDLYIYNKGKDIPSYFGNYYIRDLENIGLDQASHIQFIIDNYDNLPDIVLFTQDDFDNHIKNHNIYMSSSPLGNVDFYIKLMIHQAKVRGFSQNAFAYNAGPFTPSYQFKIDKSYGEHMTNQTFGQWFEDNLKQPYPIAEFLWFKNAIFAVHKKYILTRSKNEYINILKQFKFRRNELDHFMERSWYYLLNLDKDI